MIPHYLLGCDELPERKAAALTHFKESGVPVTYFRGFYGRSWGLRTVKEYEPGKHLPVGHVALNLGTWAMWQHIYMHHGKTAVGNDAYALFEDDAVLPSMYKELLAGIERELAAYFEDWDLVFLGLAEVEPHVWNKVTERIGPPASRLCRLNDPFGTHAYLVRHRALPVLLDNMAVAERNLDQQLWERVLKPGKLKWCAVLPSIVTQRTFDYKNTGKPEWEPSCLFAPGEEAPPPPKTPILLDERDAKALAGAPAVRQPADLPGRPTLELVTATLAVVDPFPCIYRGEPIEGDAYTPAGRSIPAWQCARLNAPCHTKGTKLSPAATESGVAVVDCEACGHRKEMSPTARRPRLPIPDGHFNPSIAYWGGKLILATRDSWGHSKVALWELINAARDWSGAWTCKPIGSFASEHPEAPRLEDPRLFVAPHPDTQQPHLHAMFNLPDGYPPKLVQVGYVRFDRALSGIEYTDVFRSPHGNLYEKNWVPFHSERTGDLHWVYATKPDHIVLGRSAWSTPNPLPWTAGAVRGGAAPVLVESDPAHGNRDVYYHFFHGCLKRIQGSVYTVGCCVFEASPPFKVLRQTPVPLVWPDLPAADEDVVKRYVVWPGGAIRHAGAWHLAIGIDDSFSRIVRIPVADVEAALSDEPEDVTVTSIRSTKIALGFNEPGG